jgi:hypothetical protein
MATTPAAKIISALLGGGSAALLSESIATLAVHDFREVCCTLCCGRNEVAANCQERAEKIDSVLLMNGAGSPPINCKVYALSEGWCPLILSAPLDLRSMNTPGSDA